MQMTPPWKIKPSTTLWHILLRSLNSPSSHCAGENSVTSMFRRHSRTTTDVSSFLEGYALSLFVQWQRETSHIPANFVLQWLPLLHAWPEGCLQHWYYLNLGTRQRGVTSSQRIHRRQNAGSTHGKATGMTSPSWLWTAIHLSSLRWQWAGSPPGMPLSSQSRTSLDVMLPSSQLIILQCWFTWPGCFSWLPPKSLPPSIAPPCVLAVPLRYVNFFNPFTGHIYNTLPWPVFLHYTMNFFKRWVLSCLVN